VQWDGEEGLHVAGVAAVHEGRPPLLCSREVDQVLAAVAEGVETGSVADGVLHGIDLEGAGSGVCRGARPVLHHHGDAHGIASLDGRVDRLHEPLEIGAEVVEPLG
jgi:hypothetical protein